MNIFNKFVAQKKAPAGGSLPLLDNTETTVERKNAYKR